jgi:hypothetical protein
MPLLQLKMLVLLTLPKVARILESQRKSSMGGCDSGVNGSQNCEHDTWLYYLLPIGNIIIFCSLAQSHLDHLHHVGVCCPTVPNLDLGGRRH